MSESQFTLDEVFEAYYKCRRNKRNTHNALAFEQDYMSECVRLHRELSDGTYRIGRSIVFLVTRPKLREVFAADFRDRIVHHLIMSRLEPLFEQVFIDDNYNCRQGKGTLYGIHRLHGHIRQCSHEYTRDCWVLKGDMQGFFMSIHKPTLWRMLEVFIRGRYRGEDIAQLMWLSKMVAMHCPEQGCIIKGDRRQWRHLSPEKSLFTSGGDYGLPIGNLTSQMFANFYLADFDRWLSHRFSHYGRYVDDFFIVSIDKQALLKVLPEVRERLARLHVKLHPHKMELQHYSKGVKFIGAVSKWSRLYVSNRTVGNMRRAIEELNRMPHKDEHLGEFVSRMNSYLGILGHYDSYHIRRRMMGMVDKEWWRYSYVYGRFERVKARRRQGANGLSSPNIPKLLLTSQTI